MPMLGCVVQSRWARTVFDAALWTVQVHQAGRQAGSLELRRRRFVRLIHLCVAAEMLCVDAGLVLCSIHMHMQAHAARR